MEIGPIQIIAVGFVDPKLDGSVLGALMDASDAGHIKIYLDGSETPVIDKPFGAYFGDLEKKFPGLAMTLSRGRNEFIPISAPF